MSNENDMPQGLRPLAEIMKDAAEREARPPTDPRSPTGYTLDDEYLTLLWGHYEYDVEICRLASPEAVLGMVAHVSEKSWQGFSGPRLSRLIRELARRRNWSLDW